jgi:hypothetical protein
MNPPPTADATTHAPVCAINLTIHNMKHMLPSHPQGLHGEESGYTLPSGASSCCGSELSEE